MTDRTESNRARVQMPHARQSLWAPLDRSASSPDLLRVWDQDRYRSFSWEDWLRGSLAVAGGLRALGIKRGDPVACLLTNSPDACMSVLGVWCSGGCLVSLPLIARGMSLPDYLVMLRKIISRANPALVLCDPAFAGELSRAALSVRVISFADIAGSTAVEPDPPGDEDPAFVQFSSGSTTEPRGCVLSPAAIAWQLSSLATALEIDPEEDTGAVWLPLSHDMGLFGCLLLTYWTGHRLVLSSPERFLMNPRSWWDDAGRFRATVSATPNFALDLAARVAHARSLPRFRMRKLVIGGERIDADVLTRANEALGDQRLSMDALLPAYGLAEAVLAATMRKVGAGPRVIRLDAASLATGQVCPANDGPATRSATVVSVGSPLPGVSIDISSGEVGEIIVRSPSLATRYLAAPELTARKFTSAGLSTGDLGFLFDGELFVTGRLDDLVCVAGRNIYSRDIEQAVAEVRGVRAGGCAIVDVEEQGQTRLVALVELSRPHPDPAVVAEGIIKRAQSAAGVAVHGCLFVERGQLPKTPSGKIQRFRCRELATAASARLGRGRYSTLEPAADS